MKRAGLLLVLVGCRAELVHVRPKGGDSGETTNESGGDQLPADIRLNEVRVRDIALVELVNVGGTEQVLAGWSLEVDGACATSFTVDTIVSPSGRLPLWTDGALTCPISDSSTLVLRDESGATVDSVDFEGPLARWSWCRIPDGTGDFRACAQFTPGEVNSDDEETVTVPPLWSWTAESPASGILASADERELWVGMQQTGEIVRLETRTGAVISTQAIPGLESVSSGLTPVGGLARGADGAVLLASPSHHAVYSLDPSSLATTLVWDLGDEVPFNLQTTAGCALVVRLQADERVVCHTDGRVVWSIADVDDGDFAGPRQMEAFGDLLLVALREGGMVVALDSATGERVGTISAPATRDAADIEPGTVDLRTGGVAPSAADALVWVADPLRGVVMAFDASDPSVLYDASQAWGFVGEFGELGREDGQFADIQKVMIVPESRILLVRDLGDKRLQAFDLDVVMETAIR